MKKYKILMEELQVLEEKAIIFKSTAKIKHTKSGNALILAGGGGSGKGFVFDNFISFEGKIFNVDVIKERILKLKSLKSKLNIFLKKNQVKGEPLKTFDTIKLNNKDDTSLLHAFDKQIGLSQKVEKTFFASIKNNKNKPNVIFDVTASQSKKLDDISKSLKNAGYKKENIHVVWILTELNIALANAKKRKGRSISEDIVVSTYRGTSITLKKLFDNMEGESRDIDGDIWIVFNDGKNEPLLYKIKESGKPITNTAERIAAHDMMTSVEENRSSELSNRNKK